MPKFEVEGYEIGTTGSGADLEVNADRYAELFFLYNIMRSLRKLANG